ncbi:MAG: hypothetical protein AAB381_00490 [Patescibacteria group bacterium]
MNTNMQYQRGFGTPAIIAIIGVLLLGGGYYYSKTTGNENTLGYLSEKQTLEVAQRVILVDLKDFSTAECLDFDGIREGGFVTYAVSRKFGNGCKGEQGSAPALPKVKVNLTTGDAFVGGLDGYFDPVATALTQSQSSNDWKTYTNPHQGVTVKYPSDWQFEEGHDLKDMSQAWFVQLRDNTQKVTQDTDHPRDGVAIIKRSACDPSTDGIWTVGFADAYYRTDCVYDFTVMSVALTENSKKTEEQILSAISIPKLPPGDALINISPSISFHKDDWGISFQIPTGWTMTNNIDSQVVLTQSSSGDRITLDYTKSYSYTDIDAKFGSITYAFNDVSGKWMQIGGDERSQSQTASEAHPLFMISDIVPVFTGVSRWRTYIIAMPDNVFLKVNITGSGQIQPLDEFIKTITISS